MATESASEPTDDRVTASSATPVEPTVAEPAPVQSGTGETGAAPTSAPEVVPAATSTVAASTAASTAAQPTVVFVTAPQPPKKRGARGVGALVALLSTGIFAASYALLVLLIALIGSRSGLAPALQFLSSVTFWVPVIVFFLSYLLLVVIVNRAGWWAHVLGGFIVAVLVWVGFVGAAIIAAGAFGGTVSEVGSVVLQQLTNPLGFAAAIAAREVPIWVGGLVAKRGRSARARNEAARTAYEHELAEHRATIGASTAV